MRLVARAAVLLMALAGVAPRVAVAQAREPLRVTVDWRGVSDADVQRCGLSRLRAGTLERLVDDGYAVVDAAGADGIAVSVASAGDGIRVAAAGGGVTREDTLHAGTGCDATFVLDVISRTSELVDEVARARPPAPAAAIDTMPPPPAPDVQTPSDQPPRAAWQAALEAAMRVDNAPDWQAGGGLSVRARLPAALELGARAELTGNARHGVTVLEPALFVTGAWQPSLPGAGVYVEAGPLLHHAASDARSVLELDAAFGAGLQLSLGHFLAQFGAYARLRSFEHRVGPQTAFDTGRVGLVLRLGAQLSGS